MKKTRCFSVLPGRLRLLRIGLGSAAFLSGALLLADVLVNAGGGSSNADKTGNGGGILDYGQVTFSGSASYENNTVRGFSQGGAVYAGSVVQQAAVSFTGNRAEGGSGGALYSRGNVQVAAGSSFFLVGGFRPFPATRRPTTGAPCAWMPMTGRRSAP